MLLSCVYEGGEHLQRLAWGLYQKYSPADPEEPFPPLATPCLFILHPILASISNCCPHSVIFSQLQILAQMPHMRTWSLSRPHPEQDSCTSASELGRAHLPLLCLRHKQRVYHLQVFTVLKTKVFKTCPCEFVSNQCNN